MHAPMAEDAEERLTELEIRYAHQARLVQDLSEVLYVQQKELDRLFSRLRELEKKVAGEPGLVDAQVQEKPPHY